MIDIIIDTLLDALKILPFLFVAFLIIELIEHKLTNKAQEIIQKSGKIGPLLGGLFGAIPQCGFSVMATNLYVTRIISLGTLISIYLSTSDEMLPLLISNKVDFLIILKFILIKFIIGMIAGFIINYILKNKKKQTVDYKICDDEHCHCKDGIFKSSLKHTGKTLLFIIIISFIINILFTYLGEEYLSKIFLKNSLFGPFVSSLIGLIPNCGASVMITELYLNNAITFGAAIAGLLSGSGVAILILFKSNKNIKENFIILGILYGIGAISGLIIELITRLII